MNVKTLLESAVLNFSSNISETLKNNNTDISKLITKIELIDNWNNVKLDINCIKLLHEVKYDLITSIQFASMGIYRNAFISLRSALELGISFVKFVDDNYHYMLWCKNKYNITWSSLISKDDGVLTIKYLNLFSDIDENKINLIRDRVDESYSICSESVHGKFIYMQTFYDTRLNYDSHRFDVFIKTFNDIVDSLNIMYALRFSQDIDKMNGENKIILEEIIGKYELREIVFNGE